MSQSICVRERLESRFLRSSVCVLVFFSVCGDQGQRFFRQESKESAPVGPNIPGIVVFTVPAAVPLSLPKV